MSQSQTKHLSRTNKKKKKLQARKEQSVKDKRKNEMKNYLKYGSFVLIAVVIGFLLFEFLKPVEGAPAIEIIPEKINLGDISVKGGLFTVNLEIINSGESNLIINDMETSCGCTSAAIVYNGVESPPFKMKHSDFNPKDWSQIIGPNETAKLKIVYDPATHQDLRGKVVRSITLYTNDPKNKEKIVYIRLNQVD